MFSFLASLLAVLAALSRLNVSSISLDSLILTRWLNVTLLVMCLSFVAVFMVIFLLHLIPCKRLLMPSVRLSSPMNPFPTLCGRVILRLRRFIVPHLTPNSVKSSLSSVLP